MGSTNIKILIPFPLSVFLSIIKQGNINTITLKIKVPRHGINEAATTSKERPATEWNGPKFLLGENVTEFHELKTSHSCKDVINFQEAQRTIQQGCTTFLQNHEGKPKYGE